MNKNEQPHCDMFSLPEACPECGYEENVAAGIYDNCGCRWNICDGVKVFEEHGRFASNPKIIPQVL